jgi:hypothetical protein
MSPSGRLCKIGFPRIEWCELAGNRLIVRSIGHLECNNVVVAESTVFLELRFLRSTLSSHH